MAYFMCVFHVRRNTSQLTMTENARLHESFPIKIIDILCVDFPIFPISHNSQVYFCENVTDSISVILQTTRQRSGIKFSTYEEFW